MTRQSYEQTPLIYSSVFHPREVQDDVFLDIHPDVRGELEFEFNKLFYQVDRWSGGRYRFTNEDSKSMPITKKARLYLKNLIEELKVGEDSNNKELIERWIYELKHLISAYQGIRHNADNSITEHGKKTLNAIKRMVLESPEARAYAQLVQAKEEYETAFYEGRLTPQMEEQLTKLMSEIHSEKLVPNIRNIQAFFERVYFVLLKKQFRGLSDTQESDLEALLALSYRLRHINFFNDHIKSLCHEEQCAEGNFSAQLVLAIQREKSYSYAMTAELQRLGFPDTHSFVKTISKPHISDIDKNMEGCMVHLSDIYGSREGSYSEQVKAFSKKSLVEKMDTIYKVFGISITNKYGETLDLENREKERRLSIFLNKLYSTLSLFDEREVRTCVKDIRIFFEHNNPGAYMDGSGIMVMPVVESIRSMRSIIIHEFAHLRHAKLYEIDPDLIRSFFRDIYETDLGRQSTEKAKVVMSTEDKDVPSEWKNMKKRYTHIAPLFGFMHPYAVRYYNSINPDIQLIKCTYLEDVSTFTEECLESFMEKSDPFLGNENNTDFTDYLPLYRMKLEKLYQHGFFGKHSKEIYDYMSELLDQYESNS